MAVESRYSIKEIYLLDSFRRRYGDLSQINYFGDDNQDDEEFRRRSKELIRRMIGEEMD